MMIKCHECGAEISDSAMSCPKCGAKTLLAKRREAGNVRTFIFIGCMVTCAVFGWIILDLYEKEAHAKWASNAMTSYFDAKAAAEKAKQIGEEAASVVKSEMPLSDDVLGDEYSLKKFDGYWEVYKGDRSTGFQAVDRNECLKYVKSLRER